MNSDLKIEKALAVILCNQRQCWEQGLGSQVMLQLGREDLALLFVRDALVRQLTDGRPGMVDGILANVDTASFVDVLKFAAKKTGDKRYLTATWQLADWLLHQAPRSKDGILYQLTDRPQIWADSLYFLPAGLCCLGYPDLAMQQFNGIHQRLWNTQVNLYSHMWDEETQRMARSAFWASGNGWAAAGIARLIELLPAEMTGERTLLVNQQRTLINALTGQLRADGLFHDVLDDPDSFVESCSVAMTAFAIFKGLDEGYLDPSLLQPALTMQSAVNAQVDDFGVVQNACSSPSFDRSGTSTEAQCFYILMELAAQKYFNKQSMP